MSLAESTACWGDHFEHRTAGCPFRRRGRGIGASYYAIWDTTSPSVSFGKIAEFVIDAAVVLAIITIVIAGSNSSCGKEYWSVSVKGFWRL